VLNNTSCLVYWLHQRNPHITNNLILSSVILPVLKHIFHRSNLASHIYLMVDRYIITKLFRRRIDTKTKLRICMVICVRRKEERSSDGDCIEVLWDKRIGVLRAGARTNEIIAKYATCVWVCFSFSIIRSFVVMILDRANQHKCGLFRRDARWRVFVTWQGWSICYVHEHDFESSWL